MPTSIHILHLLPYLETGGTEKHVLTLVNSLRQLGLASGEVLAPPGPFAAELARSGITYTPFPAASEGVIASYRGFRQAYHKLAPGADLVHVHGSPDLLLFAAAVRAKKVPRLLTVHGFHGKGANASYRFAAFFGNRLAQAVICVTGSEERLLLAAGLHQAKLHRVYNGVDDPARAEVAGGGAGMKAGAGEAGSPNAPSKAPEVRLAFIGRLARVKGVDVLLQAMAALAIDAPRLHLDIMGVGSEEAALREMANTLGIASQVVFHGYCSDAVARLADCDIFCLPSREDMGPLVCAEAMAQGKPVVSTFVGGIPEMVQNGVTGLLVPADDISALAAAIARLGRDAALRRTMGAAGRRRYEANFTQESMARHTYAVYRALLPPM